MAYVGNNPKFDSIILKDLLNGSVNNPPPGFFKRVVRFGKSLLRDSTGIETLDSGGGGTGRNYVFSPSSYSAAASAAALGWFVSGGTPTTITTGLPRASDLSAIQFVSTTTGDYIRFRFKADDPDLSHRLQALFSQIAVFGDYKLQAFSGTDAALSSPVEIIMQSIYTTPAGVTNLPTATADIVTNFDTTTRQFYEVRWTALAGGKTIKFSGVSIGAGALSSQVSQTDDVSFPAIFNNVGGTYSVAHSLWRRDVSYLLLNVKVTFTSPGSGTTLRVSMSLPISGITIDPTRTAIVGNASGRVGQGAGLGNGTFSDASASTEAGTVSIIEVAGQSDNTIGFGSSNPELQTATLSIVGANVGTNDTLFFQARIPITEWRNSAVVSTINPIANSPLRAGIIQSFAGATTPQGWLDCDGTAYPRDQYPQLFAQLQTTWDTQTNPLTGSAYASPGGSNFRVPDLRGVFLRGVGTFADGIGTDTTLAGYQADQAQSHIHAISSNGGTGGAVHNVLVSTNGGAPSPVGNVQIMGLPVTDGVNGTPRTGKETRPRNVGIRRIIKAWDESFNTAALEAAGPAGNLGLVAAGRIPGSATGAAIGGGNIGQVIPLAYSSVAISSAGAWFGNSTPMALLPIGIWLLMVQLAPGQISTVYVANLSASITPGAGAIIPGNIFATSVASLIGSFASSPVPYAVTTNNTPIYAHAYSTSPSVSCSLVGYAMRVG